MDVLVQLEEGAAHSPVLAYVNSVPSSIGAERSCRDVVTLYGVPSPESLALALAAAVESHRDGESANVIRHLGIWAERGAVGDAAWRDRASGQLMTRDLDIPLDRLRETAAELLADCGQLLRRLVAGLLTPDWPEGARRAITFNLAPRPVFAGAACGEGFLDLMREAHAFDYHGD